MEALTGLTAAEVEERRRAGRVNTPPPPSTRSVREIIRANVFTTVNIIMTTLLVLVLIAGAPGDALFAGVIVSNSVIGVVQEIRAKRTLDQLEVVNTPTVTAVREGVVVELSPGDVVADELLVIETGDQLAVDAEVVAGLGLELDESLLTGEADPIEKVDGDTVLSGSFVVAGSGHVRATGIGADSYANSLAEEARRFVLVNSELKAGINVILRWLTFIIPPVSIVLLWRLLDAEPTWQEALRGTVAAAVAMVPDGLVLLTSITFIVGILALARRKALAKELASVELLARVDVLCLDKTGTITTGNISFAEAVAYDDRLPAALGALGASDPHPNATLAAIAAAADDPGWTLVDTVPFSSARKWSAARFEGHGWWIMGAPEFVAPHVDLPDATERAESGQRVIAVAHSNSDVTNDQPLPDDLTIAGLAVLEDEIRPDAADIFRFLGEQGISLRVISGDHPRTVAAVASRAGVPRAGTGVDARDLPTDDDELADLMTEQVVYGRVTPHQKRSMVHALQSRGHVVAMTGDGVNDVLALKDADMGIAMGSGSAASRAVAQITLLDNRFSTLPLVLAEGRRVINNIERVATLFVAKAVYAVLIAVAVGVLGSQFPFLPRHFTLIGSFSIGIPGFFLALAPNVAHARAGFIHRVIRLAVPLGAIAGITSVVAYEIVRRDDAATLAEARTVAVITLLAVGLAILTVAARPLTIARIALVAAMAGSYALIMWIDFASDYFELVTLTSSQWWTVVVTSGVGVLAIAVAVVLIDRHEANIDRQQHTGGTST